MQTPPPAHKPPATPAARPSVGGGRTLQSLSAPLQRGLHRIDDLLLQLLDAPYPAQGRDAVRLEVALLLRLRRGLAPHVRGPEARDQARIDAVLADALLESVDAASATVADLEGEPVVRFARWASFCRELLAELAALGDKDLADLRARQERASRRVGDRGATPGDLGRELGGLYAALHTRLEAKSPLRRPTLLDEALGHAQAPRA